MPSDDKKWCEANPPAELARYVEEFVDARSDEATASGRWRQTVTRQLARLGRQLNEMQQLQAGEAARPTEGEAAAKNMLKRGPLAEAHPLGLSGDAALGSTAYSC